MMHLSMEKNSSSLSDTVMHTLLGQIFSGERKVGDRLPTERELAEQLGVSRSSVHLAILSLAENGFLEILPRQGTRVCDYRKHPTPGSLPLLMSYGSVELEQSLFADMMDTRLLLETESARLACRNIYETTFLEMQSLIDRLTEPDADVPDLLYGFHYRLVQASGNSVYAMIFRGFEPVLRSLIALHYRIQHGDVPAAATQRRALLDAIHAGDEALASRLAREIVAQGIGVIETCYDWSTKHRSSRLL